MGDGCAGILGFGGSSSLIVSIVIAFIGACILIAILHAVSGGGSAQSRGSETFCRRLGWWRALVGRQREGAARASQTVDLPPEQSWRPEWGDLRLEAGDEGARLDRRMRRNVIDWLLRIQGRALAADFHPVRRSARWTA